MTLPTDFDSYDYKFNKTLNEDVKLKSDSYGFFDLAMENGDYVNVTGTNSLLNACIIAIMTRYNELKNSTYTEFGCRVHELIKSNQTGMFLFNLENYITEVLENMRRIQLVNQITITKTDADSYRVDFEVTSINDEIVQGHVVL